MEISITILGLMLAASAFSAEVAKSPSDLVHLANSHVAFDWQAMGDV